MLFASIDVIIIHGNYLEAEPKCIWEHHILLQLTNYIFIFHILYTVKQPVKGNCLCTRSINESYTCSATDFHVENIDCKLETRQTSKLVIQMMTMNCAIFCFELRITFRKHSDAPQMQTIILQIIHFHKHMSYKITISNQSCSHY